MVSAAAGLDPPQPGAARGRARGRRLPLPSCPSPRLRLQDLFDAGRIARREPAHPGCSCGPVEAGGEWPDGPGAEADVHRVHRYHGRSDFIGTTAIGGGLDPRRMLLSRKRLWTDA